MLLLRKTLIASAFILGSFSTYPATAHEQSSCCLEKGLKLCHTAEKESLHSLCNQYWDWLMRENPDEATFHGYPGQNGRWPNLSQKAIDSRDDFVARLLTSLNNLQISHLDNEDQITYSILKKLLENRQIEGQFGNQYLLIDQMNGIHLTAALVMEMMPKNTVEDYQNILRRLYKLPRLLRQTTELLLKELKKALLHPVLPFKMSLSNSLIRSILTP